MVAGCEHCQLRAAIEVVPYTSANRRSSLGNGIAGKPPRNSLPVVAKYAGTELALARVHSEDGDQPTATSCQ
jgi:hypothetical protein